ncbi:MAG: FKBP12-associated protein [Chaenotheca gracillima]|nr:MAG: FKBP12-associated protein [Chaenotheca gracillima]
MPFRKKHPPRHIADATLVIDNGAYSIKAGLTSSTSETESVCHTIPNCLGRARDKKIWVGSQLEKCKDFGEMAFRRPVEKGFLVNWEAEKEIWEHSFFDKDAKLKCDPSETNLILTEAPNAPQPLQSNCDQMVFEDFQFASYYRCIAPSLNAYNDIQSIYGAPPNPDHSLPEEILLVIDSGFSHTTVTPVLHGRPIQAAIRRLDIGGKFLTNYLTELVSIRHYHMMDEPHLMNEVKEDVCYVSSDFNADLERTWKGAVGDKRRKQERDAGSDNIVLDYVLPDYKTNLRGFARPHDPSLAAKRKKLGPSAGAGEVVDDFMTLGNERFTVPELLFRPGDVQMRQSGLAEVVMQSLSVLPGGLWPALLANVVVVGGNAKIKGFVERLEKELRQLAPAECVVRVGSPSDPVTSTLQGGLTFASSPATQPALKHVLVTREEYLEHGAGLLKEKFAQVPL